MKKGATGVLYYICTYCTLYCVYMLCTTHTCTPVRMIEKVGMRTFPTYTRAPHAPHHRHHIAWHHSVTPPTSGTTARAQRLAISSMRLPIGIVDDRIGSSCVAAASRGQLFASRTSAKCDLPEADKNACA